MQRRLRNIYRTNSFEMRLADGSIILEEIFSLNIMETIYKNIETYSDSINLI
jgi:hypothetical protein